VRLSGGLTHKGESFYISVANQGYPLREPKRLAVRGYRGDEAQGSEGSGIGLWIVKNIMLAHKGSLEIIPTTSQGVNDFRLVFPKLKTGAA
jgi:signal transduction histidine kinase